MLLDMRWSTAATVINTRITAINSANGSCRMKHCELFRAEMIFRGEIEFIARTSRTHHKLRPYHGSETKTLFEHGAYLIHGGFLVFMAFPCEVHVRIPTGFARRSRHTHYSLPRTGGLQWRWKFCDGEKKAYEVIVWGVENCNLMDF